MKTEYIIQALSANLELLEIIALTTLAYALTKKDESKKTLVYLLILLRYLFPVASRFVKDENLLGLSDCTKDYGILGVKAVFSLVLYLASQ